MKTLLLIPATVVAISPSSSKPVKKLAKVEKVKPKVGSGRLIYSECQEKKKGSSLVQDGNETEGAIAPAVPKLMSGYAKVGCFNNNPKLDKSEEHMYVLPESDREGMYIKKCFDYCRDPANGNFSYFFIRQQKHCSCATYANLEATTDCNAPCNGNSAEICGGMGTQASTFHMFQCDTDLQKVKMEAVGLAESEYNLYYMMTMEVMGRVAAMKTALHQAPSEAGGLVNGFRQHVQDLRAMNDNCRHHVTSFSDMITYVKGLKTNTTHAAINIEEGKAMMLEENAKASGACMPLMNTIEKMSIGNFRKAAGITDESFETDPAYHKFLLPSTEVPSRNPIPSKEQLRSLHKSNPSKYSTVTDDQYDKLKAVHSDWQKANYFLSGKVQKVLSGSERDMDEKTCYKAMEISGAAAANFYHAATQQKSASTALAQTDKKPSLLENAKVKNLLRKMKTNTSRLDESDVQAAIDATKAYGRIWGSAWSGCDMGHPDVNYTNECWWGNDHENCWTKLESAQSFGQWHQSWAVWISYSFYYIVNKDADNSNNWWGNWPEDGQEDEWMAAMGKAPAHYCNLFGGKCMCAKRPAIPEGKEKTPGFMDVDHSWKPDWHHDDDEWAERYNDYWDAVDHWCEEKQCVRVDPPCGMTQNEDQMWWYGHGDDYEDPVLKNNQIDFKEGSGIGMVNGQCSGGLGRASGTNYCVLMESAEEFIAAPNPKGDKAPFMVTGYMNNINFKSALSAGSMSWQLDLLFNNVTVPAATEETL